MYINKQSKYTVVLNSMPVAPHPPAIRPTSTRCMGPVFGTMKETAVQNKTVVLK